MLALMNQEGRPLNECHKIKFQTKMQCLCCVIFFWPNKVKKTNINLSHFTRSSIFDANKFVLYRNHKFLFLPFLPNDSQALNTNFQIIKIEGNKLHTGLYNSAYGNLFRAIRYFGKEKFQRIFGHKAQVSETMSKGKIYNLSKRKTGSLKDKQRSHDKWIKQVFQQ